jgi:hypothetical protein
MLGVVFDAMDVLISLMVISTAEYATTSVTRRELLVEITVVVLIHFLISITMAIAVVILMTTTTSMSTVTVTTVITSAAAATFTVNVAARVDWGWTIAWIRWLLATWVF